MIATVESTCCGAIQRCAKDERLFLYFVVFAFRHLARLQFQFLLVPLVFLSPRRLFSSRSCTRSRTKYRRGTMDMALDSWGCVFNLPNSSSGSCTRTTKRPSGDDFACERHRDVMVANFHPQEWYVNLLVDSSNLKAAVETHLGRRCQDDVWPPRPPSRDSGWTVERTASTYRRAGVFRR